jgi:hypothetical protein
VQRCTVARQGDLFAGNFYPENEYNPYTDDPHVLFAAAKIPVKSARPGTQPRKTRARNLSA